MPIVFKVATGAESGGIESYAASTFAGTVTTPAPRSPKQTYVTKYSSKTTTRSKPYTAGSGWITVGFDIQFPYQVLDPGQAFFSVNNGIDKYLTLVYDDDPTIQSVQMLVADGTPTPAFSGFTPNEWHRVEIKFKKSNTSQIRLWVDGVLKVDEASEDLDPGGTNLVLSFNNGLNYPNYFVSHAYVLEDDGANIDSEDTAPRRYSVLGPYQNTTQGAAGDGGFDVLDAGTWGNAGDTPRNNAFQAAYALTETNTKQDWAHTDDGDRTGPNGDGDADDGGTIMGAWCVWTAKSRQAGIGDNKLIDFYGKYGVSGVSTATTLLMSNVPTAYNHFQVYLDAADSHVPNASQYFTVGMRMRGGGSFASHKGILADQWAFILYQEAPATLLLLSPNKRSNMALGVKRNIQ